MSDMLEAIFWDPHQRARICCTVNLKREHVSTSLKDRSFKLFELANDVIRASMSAIQKTEATYVHVDKISQNAV